MEYKLELVISGESQPLTEDWDWEAFLNKAVALTEQEGVCVGGGLQPYSKLDSLLDQLAIGILTIARHFPRIWKWLRSPA